MTDIYLVVQGCLTEEERQRFLDAVVTKNHGLAGRASC